MPEIIILRSIAELREWRRSLPARARVGFVPTMGALHEGHLSLIHRSLKETDFTVASIFVNPLQFGPNEDLTKYPRPFEKDLALLSEAGAHALFAPPANEMYPTDASTYVHEEKVSAPLCGEFRPGHFRGVCTVVLKLFNLVQPEKAFFGQKDAQQCAVLKRMVRDLNVPVEMVIVPTVREADGLALSSRNIYLSPEDRARAPRIYQSLRLVEEAYQRGEHRAEKLAAIGRNWLEQDSAFRIQYYSVVDQESLTATRSIPTTGALVAVATYLGNTRLIDNLLL